MSAARAYALLDGASSVAEVGSSGPLPARWQGWVIKNKRGASVDGGKAFIELCSGLLQETTPEPQAG
jgi:hypothetical protein